MNDKLEFINYYIKNLNDSIENTSTGVVAESMVVARDYFESIANDLKNYYKLNEHESKDVLQVTKMDFDILYSIIKTHKSINETFNWLIADVNNSIEHLRKGDILLNLKNEINLLINYRNALVAFGQVLKEKDGN